MNFSLEKINSEDVLQFKKDMQEAFQKGFEDVYGKTNGIILPEQDIDSSLNEKGSIAYKAVVDGNMVGGAVVVIDVVSGSVGWILSDGFLSAIAAIKATTNNKIIVPIADFLRMFFKSILSLLFVGVNKLVNHRHKLGTLSQIKLFEQT